MECLKPFSSVRTWEFLHSSKYNVKWTNMQYEVNNVLNLQMKTSDREFCFILVLALTVTCALWTNHLRILFSWTRTVVYHLLVYTSIRLSIVRPSINPSWGLLSGEITRGVVEECFLSCYLYPKVINEQSKYHLFQFVIFCNLTKDTLVFHFRLFNFFFFITYPRKTTQPFLISVSVCEIEILFPTPQGYCETAVIAGMKVLV